jgi:hypothetical protein
MPDVPCETQQPPDLRTKIQAPPQQQKVDHSRVPGSRYEAAARKDLLAMLNEQARMLGTPLRVRGIGPTVTLNSKPLAQADGRIKAR